MGENVSVCVHDKKTVTELLLKHAFKTTGKLMLISLRKSESVEEVRSVKNG